MSKKDVSTRPTIESITPLSAATFNSNGADTDPRNRRQWIKILALLGALVLLLISGGWLLYYLSQNPLQTEEVAQVPSPVPANGKKKTVEPQQKQPVPTVAPEILAEEKGAAEQKLAGYLAVRNKLNGKGVADWGEPAYIEIIQLSEAADAAFINKEFKTAAEQYSRATSMADDLIGRSPEVLTRLLDEGQAALDAGNGNLAQQKFATALMIDSTSQVARRGRKRARTIDAVIALIASGNQHEADGDLPLAADDYQEALGLDPYSPEARHALENVTGRIREAQFQLLLSEGMAAFNNHEYPAALKKLISAKALRPNSPEVREALLQVDQALRLARIAELQNQALAAEQREDWQVALKSYQAVLDIDRNVQFAGRGKNRAAEQIRIAKRLDFFLAKPDTLESDSQLKNAIRLIREAGDVEPRGPKLAARINQLERLVSIAKTPVKITIESDNLTQVAVYRVGKLGRFEVHELELRPGTYTVVGARDGYQDVRQKIVVKPGRQPIRVTIKCKVKI
jgi:hypothetical protein